MKISSATTIILTAALSSSSTVSAKSNKNNNQCFNHLPPQTSAYPYGRNYMFTQADTPWLGGPVPSTKCSGKQTKEYNNIHSANQCANTCATADVNHVSPGLTLLGYNYNCQTSQCDCIFGNPTDDIDSTVKLQTSGDWACYEADSFASPTPAPTPAQCTLPTEVTANAFGTSYIFTRESPQYSSTTCFVGNSFVPFQADNVQDCANQCAGRSPSPGGMPGSKEMVGIDYSCDTMMCTCLIGNGGTNLQSTVQLTNENMACYFVEQQQMDTQQFLRANVQRAWDY